MKTPFLPLLVLGISLFTLTLSSCDKDENYNRTDLTFQWSGSDDLLSMVKPVVTWWVYPNKVTGGEKISSTVWKKDFHYENFDSLLVYAVVTYPKPSQLPDVAGKEYKMSFHLTGEVQAYNDSHKLITSLPSETEDETRIVKGEQLDNYLNSLSGITHQVGFVVYRDGRVRDKVKYEELNWRK